VAVGAFRVAVVVIFTDYHGFRAVDNCLRIIGRAHLLVGLHIDSLWGAIDNRALIIYWSRRDIGRSSVGIAAGLVAPEESGAISKGEPPRACLCRGAECCSYSGDQDEFFHKGCWFVKTLSAGFGFVKSEALKTSELYWLFTHSNAGLCRSTCDNNHSAGK
jgi:hypothetical protein